ncbi:helix-turn-helix transcriptional regulator [Mesorhizobium sp. L-8-3]|uniref:helix-turn-helix transcriptional regulator n=1 Tax=Mesorhizobium sp. L-8-3 TaxID=2744522 RepID=UPI001929315E|nr:helix-turn-helix transcriptional regulator [Mesorhizobium sp. L-8-3]BCH23008.1 helix-turn-helix transcriptional regulator [Mesorhizobium sp. L-8-3]
MAGILTIQLALADHGREEELAVALSEERGITVVHEGDLESSAHADVVVTDSAPQDGGTPHVLWGGKAGDGTDVHASLPARTPVEVVIAAARLAAAGYRLVGGKSRRVETGDDLADMPLPARLHLSAREREVLALLAEGAPNKVIARRLGISVHTAKFHVAAVVAKLGAANRTEAIGIAMREGLVLI